MSTTYDQKNLKVSLFSLLVIFILGILCLQAFNLVADPIATSLNVEGTKAGLITAIPGIVLGIVCFIYGSLGDFVSLKKMTLIGISTLVLGSVLGFFMHEELWQVILFRAIQTAGAQVAGSVYLVITAKYIEDSEKVIYFGIFTAGYQLSTAIGIFAAGALMSIDWAYLFLIPAFSIIFLPILMKNLPETDVQDVHVDVPGFIIFGLAICLLTLFFTYNATWMILGSLLFFVVFGVYINKAEQPFITPEFFQNKRWRKAILLILIFYFVNYAVQPTAYNIYTAYYGLDASQIPMYLVWSNVVATIVAVSSGKIVGKIGREKATITAATFMILGFASAAKMASVSEVALGAAICVIYVGLGLLFSPVVDTVLSTIPSDQIGRGIGMNDLAMNVTASIGIAIYFKIMGTVPQGATADVALATYSKCFMLSAAVAVLGLVVYLAIKNKVYED